MSVLDKTGYETRDIDARPLLIFLSGLTILCLCVFFGVRSMQARMTDKVVGERAQEHPMADQREAPGAPLLQAHPTLEIEAQRAAEEHMLSSYAWIDSQAGIVRLPIERAKQVFLQRAAAAKKESGE